MVSVPAVSSLTSISQSPASMALKKPSFGRTGFDVVIRKIAEASRQGGSGVSSQLQQVEQQLLSGKEIAFKDLLVYQIHASRAHLRVEMLSKVSDGMLGTLRKLQNNGG